MKNQFNNSSRWPRARTQKRRARGSRFVEYVVAALDWRLPRPCTVWEFIFSGGDFCLLPVLQFVFDCWKMIFFSGCSIKTNVSLLFSLCSIKTHYLFLFLTLKALPSERFGPDREEFVVSH